MIVGCARYSRDRSFAVLRKHPRFLLTMAAGSIAGTFIGGKPLPRFPCPDRLRSQVVVGLSSTWCFSSYSLLSPIRDAAPSRGTERLLRQLGNRLEENGRVG